MNKILTTTALASALAFGTFLAGNLAKAQDSGQSQPCVGYKCPGGGGQGTPGQRMKGPSEENQVAPRKRMKGPGQNNQVEDQSGDQTMIKRKKRMQGEPQNNENANVESRVRVGQNNWRFDPSREHRRRHRDATFRFYFGGYWYPEPYWEVYSVRPRYGVSCREGRDIVAERFNRVRILECNGATFTYIGRRAGDDYRIMLSARTGRIIDSELI